MACTNSFKGSTMIQAWSTGNQLLWSNDCFKSKCVTQVSLLNIILGFCGSIENVSLCGMKNNDVLPELPCAGENTASERSWQREETTYRKELKLETLCGHFDPAMPEACVPWEFSTIWANKYPFLLKLVCSCFSVIYNRGSWWTDNTELINRKVSPLSSLPDRKFHTP